MGPMWFIRMARGARRPPSWTYVMIVLGVCGLAALIIGAEQILGLDLEDRNINWRSGPDLKEAD